MSEGHHMVPVWFFVGVILLIYGVLILATGIYEFSHPPATVLANLHPAIWWGAPAHHRGRCLRLPLPAAKILRLYTSGMPKSSLPSGDIFACGAYSSIKSNAMRARCTRSRPILAAKSSRCLPQG